MDFEIRICYMVLKSYCPYREERTILYIPYSTNRVVDTVRSVPYHTPFGASCTVYTIQCGAYGTYRPTVCAFFYDQMCTTIGQISIRTHPSMLEHWSARPVECACYAWASQNASPLKGLKVTWYHNVCGLDLAIGVNKHANMRERHPSG